MHRKSRIVNVVEALHKAVDEHCEHRLSLIQKAKERHAYDTKCKACLIPRVAVRICMHMCAIGCICVCTDAMYTAHSIFRTINMPECLLPCGVYIVALLYHAPQADAKKRASADEKRQAGRSRRELPDEVAAAVEAMTTAADEPGELDFDNLFGGSQPLAGQPGTPRVAAPATPVGSMGPPLMRSSTQVVDAPPIACCLIHDTLMSLLQSAAHSGV